MKMLRALVISDVVKREIEGLVIYAADPRNWYDVRDRTEGWLERLPGYNPKLSIKIFDGYRCVFSYSRDVDAQKVYRHLSISVDGDGYPSPEAVLEIARLFQFTGEVTDQERRFPNDWMLTVRRPGDNKLDNQCIIVAQDTGIPA